MNARQLNFSYEYLQEGLVNLKQCQREWPETKGQGHEVAVTLGYPLKCPFSATLGTKVMTP